jgi:hypothetical protein
MTEAEQVVGFLKKNRPKRYCDDCIFDELKLASRQKAQRVTEVWGSRWSIDGRRMFVRIARTTRPSLLLT